MYGSRYVWLRMVTPLCLRSVYDIDIHSALFHFSQIAAFIFWMSTARLYNITCPNIFLDTMRRLVLKCNTHFMWNAWSQIKINESSTHYDYIYILPWIGRFILPIFTYNYLIVVIQKLIFFLHRRVCSRKDAHAQSCVCWWRLFARGGLMGIPSARDANSVQL